jgi:site-specific DNA-cytosine methylase
VPKTASQHLEELDRRRIGLKNSSPFTQWMWDTYGDNWPDVIKTELLANNRQNMTIQEFVFRDRGTTGLPEKIRAWFNEPKQLMDNPKGPAYFERIYEKIITHDGGVWDDSPSVYDPARDFNALQGRNMDTCHPNETRLFTTREMLHIMGFPHDFELTIKNENAICQNVPVCTATDMQTAVLDYLNDKLPMEVGDAGFQNNIDERVLKIDNHNKHILVW